MTYTASTRLGVRYTEKLQPWLTESLRWYADAVGEPFQQVLELAEEEGSQGETGWVPSWGRLLNPLTCPAEALPYLAQFVGVELPKTAGEAEARKLILTESGLQRGTLASIEGACRRLLGEGVPFTLEERTALSGEEDPYHFLVIVPPGKASAALSEAIASIKPGGVFFSIVEIEGAWVSGGKTWAEIPAGKTWATIKEGEF